MERLLLHGVVERLLRLLLLQRLVVVEPLLVVAEERVEAGFERPCWDRLPEVLESESNSRVGHPIQRPV